MSAGVCKLKNTDGDTSEQLECDAWARQAIVLEPKFNHRHNGDDFLTQSLLKPGDARRALGHPLDDRM